MDRLADAIPLSDTLTEEQFLRDIALKHAGPFNSFVERAIFQFKRGVDNLTTWIDGTVVENIHWHENLFTSEN